MPVQGSFHPSYLSSPHFYNLSTKCYVGTVKGDTKIKVSDTHFSPLVHRDSHLTIKGIQVGLALFAFGKSSLTGFCFFFFMCLNMASGMTYSIIFPGIEVRLTALQFPGSSFLEMDVIFIFPVIRNLP